MNVFNSTFNKLMMLYKQQCSLHWCRCLTKSPICNENNNFHYSGCCETKTFLLVSFSTGDRCELDRRQGRCVPGVCRNGGTCRELSGGGFRCECPAGGYEHPYCTVTARSFPPKSFVMFRGLRQRFHLSMSLR